VKGLLILALLAGVLAGCATFSEGLREGVGARGVFSKHERWSP
jgi:hypothetical protein